MNECIYSYTQTHKPSVFARFCVCECTYSLKFICNHKISTHGISWAVCALVCEVVKHLSCPVCMFSADGHTLSSEFQLSYGKQVPFLQSSSCQVFCTFVLFVGNVAI